MSLVIVTWADAHSGPHGWSDLEDVSDDEYLVVSVGHLIPVGEGGKEGHVTLAQSRCPEGLVDHVINIPVGMVRSLKLIDHD